MARERGFDQLYTSYTVAKGGPEGFYRALGFVPTGETEHGEEVAALPLGAPRAGYGGDRIFIWARA